MCLLGSVSEWMIQIIVPKAYVQFYVIFLMKLAMGESTLHDI